MKKVVVLCFGSEVIEQDDIAFKVADALEREFLNLEFRKSTRPDTLLEYVDYDLVIVLDAVSNLVGVKLIGDLTVLSESRTVTSHDFDLGSMLRLLGDEQSDKVRVIGLPMHVDDIGKIVSDARDTLLTLL